jgi:predicted nuclease of predicted toxin-antitoxin system
VRFKLGENLPAEAADLLREAGHDAATVLEQGKSGKTDPNVAAVCEREGRPLVTLDTDFADIRTYPPDEYPGLFVLRLRHQDKPHVLDVLRRVLALLETEQLRGRLWIVDEERVRVRS